MKVRDLEQYLKSYITQLPTMLGSAEDMWLKEIAGSETKIKQLVGMISSFAIKTNAQILYELLQNADDANAERVCIAFDDDHFLVINNGKPFYTDTSKDNKRKGQLKQFLSKNNSEKFDDPGSIGKYGQGSKLIYDLLIPLEIEDNEQVDTTEKALQDAIITELKAPILFSWSELSHWEALKNWNIKTPVSYKGDCNSNLPLLTKPVFTYYPATLKERRDTDSGNDMELFSLHELHQCVQYIKETTPQFNEFSFVEGTLLYVRLGKGHAKALREMLKDGMLETGIASSLAFLKNLKRVQINGRHIQKPDLLEAKNLPAVKRDGQDCPTRLLYLKNPLAYQHQLYNFYQYFPITKTNFGLKFIINSYAYEIDAARQDIQLDRPQSKSALVGISKGIQQYIINLRQNKNKLELISFTQCLLATDETRLLQQGEIKVLFLDNLLETLKNNIPTQSGFADKSDEVRINDTGIDVKPSVLGITDWEWLDSSLKDYFDLAKKHLVIKRISVLKLLEKANRPDLEKWLLSLSDDRYKQLLQAIQEKTKQYSDIQDLPFIRCTDNSIHTPKELLEHPTKVFLYPSLTVLAKVLSNAGIVHGGADLVHVPNLHQLFPLPQKYYKEFIGNVLSKGSRNFDRAGKHDIIRALLPIKEANPHLGTKLVLFENAAGQKKPLVKLIKDSTDYVPGASGILEAYRLKPSEFIPELSLLLMQPHEIWQNLLEDWDVQVVSRFSECYLDVIVDLNKLYQTAGVEFDEEALPEDYTWIRCQDGGIYSFNKVYFNSEIPNLTQLEYDNLCDFILSCTYLQVLNFADIAKLNVVPFAELPHISNAEIANFWTVNELQVSLLQLEVLHKIKSDNSFLSTYKLQPNPEGKYIISLRENSKQYYSTNNPLNLYLYKQLGGNIKPKYYLLPQALLKLYENDAHLHKEDDNFVKDLINTFSAPHDFIEVIIKRSDEIKQFYLSRLDNIDLSPTQPIAKLTAKVIDYFSQGNWVEHFREKVRINGKPLSYYIYNNDVNIEHTKGQPSAHFKLSLLLPEYQEQGETLERVKDNISKAGAKYGKLFETKTFPKEQIANKLATAAAYINAEQVCFMWAYTQSLSGQQNYIPAVIKFSQLNEIDVLANAFDKKLTFYSNYPLPTGWFNPKFSIETPDKPLLLETEKVPENIRTWLREGRTADKNNFLIQAGMNTASSHILTIRRRLFDNEFTDENHLNQLIQESYFADNTLIWASHQNWNCRIEHYSNRYITLQKLLANHIERKENDYLLALYFDNADDLSKLTLRNKNSTHQPVHIKNMDNDVIHIWKEALSDARKKYALADATHSKFNNKISVFLGTELTLNPSFAEVKAEKNEWDDKHYKTWIKEDAKGYHIFKSTREIPFTYRLQVGVHIIYEQVHNKGNAQRLDDKDRHDIYIYPEQEDIVKFLMEKETELFPNDGNVLVKLVRRVYQPAVEQTKPQGDKGQHGTGGKGLTEDNNNESTTNVGSVVKTNKNGDIDVPEGMDHDKAKKLLEKIKTSEMLEKFYEHYEEIEKSLEKEDRSTPNGLIGFIGEMLVYAYLKNQFPGAKVTYTAKSKREYDIEFQLSERKLFIDVKTTIKSIKEGADTVPFYVKSSQLIFINQNPQEHYYIIRISLDDLRLKKWFDDWKPSWNLDNMEVLEEKIESKAMEHFKTTPSNAMKFKQHRLAFRLVSPSIEKALDKL